MFLFYVSSCVIVVSKKSNFEVGREGGGCELTVEIPRLTVPTNLRMEMVRAAMICSTATAVKSLN